VQDVEAEILATLSAEDRAGLDHALARIETYLDKTSAEDPADEEA